MSDLIFDLCFFYICFYLLIDSHDLKEQFEKCACLSSNPELSEKVMQGPRQNCPHKRKDTLDFFFYVLRHL